MKKPKTICTNCIHHNSQRIVCALYEHFCTHPKVQLTPNIDQVTGEKSYRERDSICGIPLWSSILRHYQSPSPLCHEINKGNCRLFEKGKNI